jgi:uncharacterized membrane protein YhaH (DUF805 family)
MDWKSLLFSFHGRINRAKYWLTMLIYTGVGMLLGLIGFVTGQGMGYQLVSGLVELVIFVSSLAVALKRLHDRDKSAWWLLFFYIAPGVLAFVAVFFGLTSSAIMGEPSDWASLWFRICLIAAFAIGVWAFVEFGCLRGTVGYNRYGPDPLAHA